MDAACGCVAAAEAWQACSDLREIPADAEVVLGFDSSYSGDATAIVAVQIGDMPHLDVVRLWEDVGGQLPIIDVEDALRIACKRWRYRRLSLTRSAGHDRYRCSPMRGCRWRSSRSHRPG